MSEINLFATFPIESTYSLPIGKNHFDFIRGIVKPATGVEVPMAKRTIEDLPLKFIWIDVDSDVNILVKYLGDTQYIGRVAADGFSFQDITYDEIIITTTAITNIQLIGSSSIISGVGSGGGGSGGSGDIETVEADIDGKQAQTTNSLGYGRQSAGVTHPIDASPANTARAVTTVVQPTQHIDATGKVQPAGESASNPIYVNVEGNIIYGELLPSASCAAGAAIEFDIASFSNLATLKQISITQLLGATFDYTFEIWEKDGAGYTPGTYADHYLKIFSRDIDVREYSENIDQGLLYRDRDATTELHCRLVNNAAGTTSTFNVSVVAIDNT